METRYISSTGDNISLLGFGGLRLPLLPGGGEADIDMKTTKEMIQIAMQGGVNYYDTSYIYHDGNSENALGEALSDYSRDSFNLASKLPLFLINSAEQADMIFEEQLKKCRVKYFDSYLMHAVTEALLLHWEKLGLLDVVRRKKAEGKIRRLGFSFHDRPDTLGRVLDTYDWDFTQIIFNYMDWYYSSTPREYEMLLQRNIPIVVMKPLRGGPMANVNGEITGMLQEANPDGSVASWGMRFAASKPGVLTVLSGMSTPEQVRDNIKTFSPFQPLTGSEEELLRKAAAAYRADGEIPCTDCGACMPCPQNVNIPAMIGAYNQYKKGGFLYDFEYCCRRLPTAQYARNCNECGQCAPLCPQKTVIPAEMTKIAELGKTVPNALNFFDF